MSQTTVLFFKNIKLHSFVHIWHKCFQVLFSIHTFIFFTAVLLVSYSVCLLYAFLTVKAGCFFKDPKLTDHALTSSNSKASVFTRQHKKSHQVQQQPSKLWWTNRRFNLDEKPWIVIFSCVQWFELRPVTV